MLSWIKSVLIKGEVKVKYIAYDDRVPIEQIEPYEDIATIPYEGEYDDFMIKMKLRKFLRVTKDHLVAEMTVIERTENGKQVKISD
jgi:hypothetical protein